VAVPALSLPRFTGLRCAIYSQRSRVQLELQLTIFICVLYLEPKTKETHKTWPLRHRENIGGEENGVMQACWKI
jgi:hypothetical protein